MMLPSFSHSDSHSSLSPSHWCPRGGGRWHSGSRQFAVLLPLMLKAGRQKPWQFLSVGKSHKRFNMVGDNSNLMPSKKAVMCFRRTKCCTKLDSYLFILQRSNWTYRNFNIANFVDCILGLTSVYTNMVIPCFNNSNRLDELGY